MAGAGAGGERVMAGAGADCGRVRAGARLAGEGRSNGARLFVALELPTAVAGPLARWSLGLEAARAGQLRVVAREALHLTLCFLGQRPLGELEAICEALQRAVAGRQAPLLCAGELMWLPTRHPGVLALAVHDPEESLAALQRDAGAALSALGVYEAERRPFRAHVTLARVRRGAHKPTATPAAPTLEPWHAERVLLLRSLTSPGASRYEPLWSAWLRRAGARAG